MLFLILSAFAGSMIGFVAFYGGGLAAGLIGMAGGGVLSILMAGGYLLHKTSRARAQHRARPVADNTRT